jgi:pimeloyl-ACP methyl ester carboxylesterase
MPGVRASASAYKGDRRQLNRDAVGRRQSGAPGNATIQQTGKKNTVVRMAFFRDKKSSLHYLVRGRGKPLLLIHGLGGSGADWAFQVAALEKRFRVIVPDLPGSGHSPPPRDGYTIQGFSATLWALLDHLGVETTDIVGFSLGGAVALEMAALRPSRVPRLGLINSLATYRPHDWRKWLETARSHPIPISARDSRWRAGRSANGSTS